MKLNCPRRRRHDERKRGLWQPSGSHVLLLRALWGTAWAEDAFAAYAEVLVCEDCNNADTEAKKLAGSPSYFSFSIGQIRRLIRSADHRPHLVEPARAEEVWAEAEPAYKLRMKLISAVAQAAATDAHWYEPHARAADPIPVFGFTRRSVESEITRWAYADPLLRTLGANTKVSAPNLSRWRQVAQKPGKQLPANLRCCARRNRMVDHGKLCQRIGAARSVPAANTSWCTWESREKLFLR